MFLKYRIGLWCIVVLLFSALWLAGCGPAGDALSGADVAPPEMNEIALGDQDNGRKIEVQQGQILAISLASNPTTGYSWQPADLDESILEPVGEAQFQAQSNLVGASGIETLRFKAGGAGTTALKLVYHRPWEKDVEPLERFEVEVTVR